MAPPPSPDSPINALAERLGFTKTDLDDQCLAAIRGALDNIGAQMKALHAPKPHLTGPDAKQAFATALGRVRAAVEVVSEETVWVPGHMRPALHRCDGWVEGCWKTKRRTTAPADIGTPMHQDNLHRLTQIMTERKSQGKLPLDKTVEAFDLYRDLIAWRGDLPEIDTSLARMAVEARQAAIEAYKDPEQSTDRNHPKNRAAKETIKAFYDMITQGGGQRPAPSGSAVGSPP